MPAAIHASVIVCTYSRCASLLDTLHVLSRQSVRPDIFWELILVDNNSRDDTRDVVHAFEQDNLDLKIKYVFEGKQGLSHARNTGISLAEGTFVLFTDDDVLPEANWIQTIVDCMETFRCDGCGGYIEPIWEKNPPAWLTERFHGYLALRTDTAGPRPVDASDDPPFGANMAFRRDVFERVGLFDVALGRKGAVLAGGEEWGLFRRVLKNGGSVMYVPQARVRHKVEAFRVTKGYFRRWRFEASRNLAQGSPIGGARRLAGVPLFLFRQLATAAVQTLRYRLLRPSDEAFRQEIIVWHFLGLIAGTWDHKRWPKS
jgi:glycosyltransferase involved in cell wall biosynthesis